MYDQLLQQLRQRWAKEPENRKIIELQAKLIKLAQSLQEKKDKSAADEVFG